MSSQRGLNPHLSRLEVAHFSDASGSLFRFSKIGEGFTDADYDNLTSFAEGELQNEL